jgi:hypothetical protein
VNTQRVRNLIRAQRDEGATVFLTTHDTLSNRTAAGLRASSSWWTPPCPNFSATSCGEMPKPSVQQ